MTTFPHLPSINYSYIYSIQNYKLVPFDIKLICPDVCLLGLFLPDCITAVWIAKGSIERDYKKYLNCRESSCFVVELLFFVLHSWCCVF